MKNYADYLSKVDLSKIPEIPLLRGSNEFNTELGRNIKQIKNIRKKRKEELSQISASCVKIDDTEKVSTSITSKVILVMFTSLITYYGIFALTYTYLIELVTPLIFYLILGGLIVLFFILFGWGIFRKNFGRTQMMVYFLLYTVTSLFGVVLAIITLYPITSYQIINTYIYIVVIQLVIFMISVPITRKLVCRSSIKPNTSDIRF